MKLISVGEVYVQESDDEQRFSRYLNRRRGTARERQTRTTQV